MIIRVYAALKEYFQTEFELEEPVTNTTALIDRLQRINPAAAALLSRCRFAVQDKFIDPEYKLDAQDKVIIIPPGSGG